MFFLVLKTCNLHLWIIHRLDIGMLLQRKEETADTKHFKNRFGGHSQCVTLQSSCWMWCWPKKRLRVLASSQQLWIDTSWISRRSQVPSPYRITTLKVSQYSSSWTVNPGIEKPGRLKITATREKKDTHTQTDRLQENQLIRLQIESQDLPIL